MRLAAIDVGTNSIRLIVAEVAADGSYRILDDEKEITRLGQGLDASGRLSPEAMEKASSAVERMRGIAEGYGADVIRAIGTAAVREAKNRDEFLGLVQERAGIPIEPISAEDEARLAFLSVAHSFDLHDANVAIADVGGGSTEIVLASGGVVEQVFTVPLGAVRVAERFPGCTTGDVGALEDMDRAIKKTMKEWIRQPAFSPQYLIGTGGTFTTLAAISMHRGATGTGPDMLPFTPRGYEIQRSEVRHILDWLDQMPVRQRLRVPGLSADRAEIIVPGLAIVERAMRRLKVNTLKVHDRGIRDGLLLTMIAERMPNGSGATPGMVDRWRALKHFATACRYEEAHSNHVADLAMQLFDQIVEQSSESLEGCNDRSARDLLLAAGILHDVGYLINYSRHHKHSYHLIVHSDIAGFSHRELELIANIARYHRRAEPTLDHPTFAKLPKRDRRLVRKLSGILRIADGLDRTHTQNVAGVTVSVRDEEVVLSVGAKDNPAVDIWGAERKSGLFRRYVGLSPRFEWAGSGSASVSRNGAAEARADMPSPRQGGRLSGLPHQPQ
ncbi:MAG TPA: Ppx/GppA phosphatase family protein [Phycisphaerales bacterium]|nr:Ppx/GppA phosphatase family protein [Phycisphaerales bacterium]